MIRSCAVRGFRIAMVIFNMQFKELNDINLLGVSTNVASKEEYVTNVEG